MISNNDLLKNYLPLKMEKYFYKKLPSENPENIKLKIIEFLKYVLLSEYSGGPIPFSNEIDEIWHLWILQTRQYQELMNALPHKRYFHHCSNSYYDPGENMVDQETEINRQISILVSYIYSFGPFKEAVLHFWPTALNLYHLHEDNLEKMNTYLISLGKKSDSRSSSTE